MISVELGRALMLIHSQLPNCSQATSNLLSVSTDLPILDVLYKWNNAVQRLLRLASFT